MKKEFLDYIENLQDQITQKLAQIDGGAKFSEDKWERPEGGGGRSRAIENGNVFEKGAVQVRSAQHRVEQAKAIFSRPARRRFQFRVPLASVRGQVPVPA